MTAQRLSTSLRQGSPGPDSMMQGDKHSASSRAGSLRPSGLSVSDLLSGPRKDPDQSGHMSQDQTRSASDAQSDKSMRSPTDDGNLSSRPSLSRTSSLATTRDNQTRRPVTPSGSELQSGEGVTAYQYAAVQQITECRENIEYILTIREQPKHSRMCGVGEKADRRPIDPAPIIQLRVVTHDHPQPGKGMHDDPERRFSHGTLQPISPLGDARSSVINALPSSQTGKRSILRRGVPVRTDWGDGWEDKTWYLENPYYFMYAMLADAETDEELHLLSDGKTRYTTGSCVSCLYHLKDIDGSEQGFFVFPDLSIRIEGRYRLKLCLFETIEHEVHHCKSIYSKPFNVYTAKRFPGMEESTLLSKSFADQGLKVRVRKNPRARRARLGGKRKDAMGSDEESDGEPPYSAGERALAMSKRVKSDPYPHRPGYGAPLPHDAFPLPEGSRPPSHPAYAYPSEPIPLRGGPPPPKYSPEQERRAAEAYHMAAHTPFSRPQPPVRTPASEMMVHAGHAPGHGPPPHPPGPPGLAYMDATEAEARRQASVSAGHRPDPYRAGYHAGEERFEQPPGSYSERAWFAAEQEAAAMREREAYYEEQEYRNRHRRSTLPVGAPPSSYGYPVRGHEPAGYGGHPPPPLPSHHGGPMSQSARDRSISDPYGGGQRIEAREPYPNGAPPQPHEGRNRLPPLHVALSPDTSPRSSRMPSGPPGYTSTQVGGEPSYYPYHGLPHGPPPPPPGAGAGGGPMYVNESMPPRHAGPPPPPQTSSMASRMPPPPPQSMKMTGSGTGPSPYNPRAYNNGSAR